MCLLFDAKKNKLKQTCTGKCKNRCGLEKHKEGRSIDLNRLTKSDEIRLSKTTLRFTDRIDSKANLPLSSISKYPTSFNPLRFFPER